MELGGEELGFSDFVDPQVPQELIGQSVFTAQVLPHEQETSLTVDLAQCVLAKRAKGIVRFTLLNTLNLFKSSARAESELSI